MLVTAPFAICANVLVKFIPYLHRFKSPPLIEKRRKERKMKITSFYCRWKVSHKKCDPKSFREKGIAYRNVLIKTPFCPFIDRTFKMRCHIRLQCHIWVLFKRYCKLVMSKCLLFCVTTDLYSHLEHWCQSGLALFTNTSNGLILFTIRTDC